MSTASVNPTVSGVDISPIAGPLILGYFFMFGLFGILSSQMYIYHVSFPGEKWTVKSMVYGIYLLAILQVTLTFYDAIITLGFGFGNFDALSNGALSFLSIPIVTATIILIAQTYYAFRIYMLTKTWIWPLIIVILSLVQCSSGYVGGIVFGTFIDDISKAPEFNRGRFTAGVMMSAASSSICDIIIATYMWGKVYSHLKGDISRTTKSILVGIMKLTIGTGAMTATVAAIAAVFVGALPHTVAFNGPCSIMAQLYANSMLVVLNNRLRIRDAEKFNLSLLTNDIQFRSFSATLFSPNTEDNSSSQPEKTK